MLRGEMAEAGCRHCAHGLVYLALFTWGYAHALGSQTSQFLSDTKVVVFIARQV